MSEGVPTPILSDIASHEALRAALTEAERERDAWHERFDSAWADMRRAVEAGPEAEVVALRTRIEEAEQAHEAGLLREIAFAQKIQELMAHVAAALAGSLSTPETCPECGSTVRSVRGAIPRPGWHCGCGIGVRHFNDCGRPKPHDPCSDAWHSPVSPEVTPEEG